MYNEEKLVGIAKRENNNKRKYLVVNKLQGKHVPVSPSQSLEMFRELAALVKDEYKNEKVLVIGFAETATAIGAAVAVEMNTNYIQTTREIIDGVDYLFFSEEHSHATEQKLVKNDIESVIYDTDRIMFVEDEVTTGNTILNIIKILEKLYPETVKYSVASILNGMDETSQQIFKERNIKLHYLVKTNHSSYDEIADRFTGDGKYIPCNTNEYENQIKEIGVKLEQNARRLTSSEKYVQACEKLWCEINKELSFAQLQNVLVIGTEEFMYPAIYVAKRIEEQGIKVRTHSTTRSPISVSSESEYPLHERFELRSFYDNERVTFIYDINKYDYVLIITDSENKDKEGINSLLNALKLKENKNIILIRWK